MSASMAGARTQLAHVVFNSSVFAVVAVIAIVLDLGASRIEALGVSAFTHTAILWTAHGVLLLDLMMFFVYSTRTSYQLLKEMFT